MRLSRQGEHTGKGRKKRGLLERREEGQGGSEAGALWGQGSEWFGEVSKGWTVPSGLGIQDPGFFFNSNFYFVLEYSWFTVLLVSGKQESDSVILGLHIHSPPDPHPI